MPDAPPFRHFDPDGHYGRLGIHPSATKADITAAFRASARVLHPDVPVTGDAAAFVALRQAYDVLSNTKRRSEYDRRARSLVEAARTAKPDPVASSTIYPDDYPPPPPPPPPSSPVPSTPGMPRLAGIPVAVWAGVGLVLGFGLVEIVAHLRSPPHEAEANIRPNAPVVAPLNPDQQKAVLYGPTPARLSGEPNAYVKPGPNGAVLWQADPAHRALKRVGELPAFSMLHVLRTDPQTGFAEILITGAMTGLVSIQHIAAGDATAARQAYCSYNTGPPPQDGELLERHASGPGKLVVENHAPQPAVMKLRNASGGVALAVYLGPGSRTEVASVPGGAYQAEFGTGELWSRACNGFTANSRTGKLDEMVRSPGAAPVVIAPDAQGSPWAEITPEAFEQE